MKTKKLFSRHNLLWLIIVCYLLPVTALLTYNVMAETGSQDWMALSTGLFLTAVGSLLLFYAMTYWEASFSKRLVPAAHSNEESLMDSVQPIASAIDPEEYKYTKLSLEEAQQMQVRLLNEIDNLTAELQNAKSDAAHAKKMAETTVSDTQEVIQSSAKQQEHQQLQIRTLHETIAEQKTLLEKKHHQMSLLESKVGDLTYEIKTLLQFAEAHSGSLFSAETAEPTPKAEEVQPEIVETPQIAPTPVAVSPSLSYNIFEGSQQLKRCLDIAQKITGSHRFGSQLYTFSEAPAESFSLDLRRLCDRLRSDTPSANSTILLYSPKENQLLFASNQIRDLTGWSPEKFIQTFGEILQDESQWKQGISSLSMRSEAQIHLPIKTRSGHSTTFQAHLGTIPTGIFRNHVIAILSTNS